MSLKIEDNLPFDEGLKSKIDSQCAHAINLLEKQAEENPNHVIHEVRKSFKKIRAALRLVRDHIDFYKTENIFFRDQGRRISEARDATSVIEGLDLIYEKYSDQLYNKTFSEFRNFLLERRKKILSQPPDINETLRAIKNDLTAKQAEISDWNFDFSDFKTIYPSVKRVYKRGRKAYQRSLASRDPDDFHEWRKRVKYLRYQIDLLNRIWPAFLTTWEDELHKLSDDLGEDRDLLMLNEIVNKNQDQFESKAAHQLLKSIIKSHRDRLQQKALLLGQRTYQLKSKKYTKILQSSWEAYDKESSLES